MKLNVNEQRQLDILIKELKVKSEMIKEGAYYINADVRSILDVVCDVLIAIERKIN
jgi:hypothetical protein